MPYRNATICRNGHVLSASKAKESMYCPKCGCETYSSCLKCNAPIRGLYDVDGVVTIGKRDYDKPYYCISCSEPLPWTQTILDNAVELLSLDSDLDDATKELIKNAIPDLIVETPATPIAVAKYRKYIGNAGQIIRDSMRQLLVDIVSEAVRKALFS